MRKTVQKLKSRKGSSLPEAMIAFLMVCLTALILVGTVTASGKIMVNADTALAQVYKEKEAFDVFTYHQYTSLDSGASSFENLAGGTYSAVKTKFVESASPTTVTFTDEGYGTAVAPVAAYNKTSSAVYCRADKHEVFCFSTSPANEIH